MGQQLNLKLKGLYTSGNELSANPEGALAAADNVVIDFDSLAQSRRGFDQLASPFNDGSARANQYVNFQNTILAHNGPQTVSAYLAGVWVDYVGVFPPPDPQLAKTKFLNANKNLYFTSSTGIQKLDSVLGTPGPAGMPPGLDIAGDIDGSASGFFPDNSQVAYRMLWGIKDANGNLVLGAPSGRAVVINTSGNPQNTTLVFTIPDGITTNHFYQLYRSATTNSSTTEPSDEMQLVYEANPTSGEITAGEITVTDITPDSLKGATLYTSPSQDGILQANTPPVYCQDLCQYKGFTFYANTKTKQRLFLTIVAVGVGGVNVGDVLTIGSTAYTAAAAENIAAGEFEVFTGGTPAQNITDTTNSLIRVINRYASNTQYYGYYVSGYNDLPGQMLLEERSVNGASFAATASANGTAYNPNLPTSGTAVESNDEENKNGIYFSKFQQSEAVPLTNQLFAGNAINDIRRIIPLRDSIIVLKTDGIFQITGSSPDSFQVTPLDLTARIFAPESAVILSNEVWMLSDQGVVSVSDTGTQVRSRPIEDQLIVLFGTALGKTKELSFGVAYETDRKYILFTVQNDGDVNPSQAFVFNTFTNTWTRWLRNQTAGFVNPTDNKLYLGSALNAFTNQERKTYTYTDYVDESIGVFDVLAEDHDNALLTLDSVAGIQVGDLVRQSSTIFSTVVSIDTVTNTLTLSSQTTFLVGVDVEVFQAIDCLITWQPCIGGNPGMVKQWREILAMFQLTRFYQALFGFRTELSQSVEEVPVGGTPQGGWGLFGWGTVPWGGSLQPKTLRTYVPQNKQYASQFSFSLNIRNGYSDWKLQGISVPYNDISVETTK